MNVSVSAGTEEKFDVFMPVRAAALAFGEIGLRRVIQKRQLGIGNNVGFVVLVGQGKASLPQYCVIESKKRDRILVEDIQDIIEQKLMDEKKFVLAKTNVSPKNLPKSERFYNTTEDTAQWY